MKDYVEFRDEGYFLIGTRISLDSMVYAYWRGQAPESIVRSFPSLNLEQVYGAITFYLGNREAVDANLKEWEKRTDELREAAAKANPELHAKLEAAKRERLTTRT